MDNMAELVYKMFTWIEENIPLTKDEHFLIEKIAIYAFDKLNPRQEGE